MSFTLEVQFTGLCMYVVDKRNPLRVAVVMPDARHRPGSTLNHVDGTDASPHAGYMRFNAASLKFGDGGAKVPSTERPGSSPSRSDGPAFEVVYRFGDLKSETGGGQTLDFNLAAGALDEVELDVPDLGDLTGGLPLNPDLFRKHAGGVPATASTVAKPSPLLFRTMLHGGELRGAPTDPKNAWTIDRRLGRKCPDMPMMGALMGEVTWSRTIDKAELTLTISDFVGQGAFDLTLVPVDGKIQLKLANLCAHNPLEWDDLDERTPGIEDSDFKWFYKLLVPPPLPGNGRAEPDSQWTQFLNGFLVAAPRVITSTDERSGDPPVDCSPGRYRADTLPPLTEWTL